MLLCAGSSPSGKRRKKNIDIIASFELVCIQRMRARRARPPPPPPAQRLMADGMTLARAKKSTRSFSLRRRKS
jgi:hypothetical protein